MLSELAALFILFVIRIANAYLCDLSVLLFNFPMPVFCERPSFAPQAAQLEQEATEQTENIVGVLSELAALFILFAIRIAHPCLCDLSALLFNSQYLPFAKAHPSPHRRRSWNRRHHRIPLALRCIGHSVTRSCWIVKSHLF